MNFLKKGIIGGAIIASPVMLAGCSLLPPPVAAPLVQAEQYVKTQIEQQLGVTVNDVGCGDGSTIIQGNLTCKVNLTYENKQYNTEVFLGVEQVDNSFNFKLKLPDLQQLTN